jgi:hypothetical protein
MHSIEIAAGSILYHPWIADDNAFWAGRVKQGKTPL